MGLYVSPPAVERSLISVVICFQFSKMLTLVDLTHVDVPFECAPAVRIARWSLGENQANCDPFTFFFRMPCAVLFK